MYTLFEDKLFNKMALKKFKKDVISAQVSATIEEIDYLSRVQNLVLEKRKYTTEPKIELDFVKKLENARKNSKI